MSHTGCIVSIRKAVHQKEVWRSLQQRDEKRLLTSTMSVLASTRLSIHSELRDDVDAGIALSFR